MANSEPFLKGKVEEAMPEVQIASLMRRVVGSPFCRRSGCYGKGYSGVRVNPDGSRTLMLCECGRLGETDYVKLMGEVVRLQAGISDLRRDINTAAIAILGESEDAKKAIADLKAVTLRETLSRWRKRISAFLTPATEPPAPADQSVPVAGEVKS